MMKYPIKKLGWISACLTFSNPLYAATAPSECFSISAERPESKVTFELQFGSIFESLTAVKKAKNASAEADAAREELEAFLLDSAEASPELDKKYSRALNLKVFAVRRTLELFEITRNTKRKVSGIDIDRKRPMIRA